MADEILDGAPEGAAEVTDLRSTIVAAVEKQRAPEPELPLEDKPVEAKTVDKPVADKPVETEAERNERLRDEKGRFAKGDEKPEAKPEVAKPQVEPVDPLKPVDAGQAASSELRPPPGWSPTAKVAFDKLPQEVKEAVAQREIEVNKGFAKLSEYKPIDRYMEMARNGGTTLDKALEAYTGIENDLRRDFTAGIARICQNQGVHPVALANAILARHGASPQQDASGDQPQVHQQPSVDPAVMQKISALENQVRQATEFVHQQQHSTVQTEIQRFASDPKHPFFENVKVTMGRLINSGQAQDLEDAYEQACWANKEIRELQIKQQTVAIPSANAAEAVQKAKAAAKATGGAPSAGFKPNGSGEGASIRDTIRAAVNSQRGI